MAKDRGIVNQIRALREAQQSSRGSRESRPATTSGVRLNPASDEAAKTGAAGQVVRKAGVASGPREAKPSSDAARTATLRKPKSVPPPSPKASAAASGATTHQYRDPEKRKAYMAKYMRDRRKRQAEQRAKVKQ